MEDGAGSHKCGRNCHTCAVVEETRQFQSKNTGRTYTVRKNINCKTKWVVYLLCCHKCGGQYVGKSKNGFGKRHSGHKQDIKNGVAGVGVHFKKCGYEHLRAILIDRVDSEGQEEDFCARQLKNKEVFWQHQLRVFEENGGNAFCIKDETKTTTIFGQNRGV